MRLYAGTSQQFIEDTIRHQIDQKLQQAFFDYFQHKASPSEVRSWRNSLSQMSSVLQYADLTDHGVILEYQLPLTSRRLDFMITGRDATRTPGAVVVELKQWDDAYPSDVEDCVVTFVGGGLREVLHPSRQVGNYQQFLEDYHIAFTSGEINLRSCSYLHNLQFDPANELFNPRHRSILEAYPIFTGDKTPELAEFLQDRVGMGEGVEVMASVLDSEFKASKKLLDHVKEMIAQQDVYVLLDEQQVVFNEVLERARRSFHEPRKTAILIVGGPGTGKSVIALNLIGELSGAGYNTHYATGSKAFTENLRKLVGPRARHQFKYFNNYQTADIDEVDVLICDEAHRIRESGNTRYTPKAERSDRPQIEHLLEAARVPVFFIDDLQVVRPNEVGSTELIKQAAQDLGVAVREFELEAQFRCGGSDGFINWVNNTLRLRDTANVLWEGDDTFDFGIVDSVEWLEAMIRAKDAAGHKARLTAGFCWPWSKPDEHGNLYPDVKIGDWWRPWNARSDSGKLARGIPKSHYWSTDPGGIDQVGCVYTAQGFEFDYVGVIFGEDLRYDSDTGSWIGDKSKSHDSEVKRGARTESEFVALLKNTYRILLTRGMSGCYVYFQDDATRDFFRSRIDTV
jgi:DUF2075 family protein